MTDLASAVAAAACNADVLDATAGVLAEAQQEIDALQSACRACGRCCDFEVAGHRLFVTTAELALLAGSACLPDIQPLKCPFQIADRCTARQRRPLGCRLYFCNDALAGSPDAIYERFHARLVDIHRCNDLPYFYVELTAGLSIYKKGL